MKTTKTVKELERLAGLLSKYAHRWGEYPSLRMQLWIDQYETLKHTDKDGWKAYCDKHGIDYTCNGYDCLA